jgi:hypothetical protein
MMRHPAPPRVAAPLALLGILTLLAGMWGGLLRLGWAIPSAESFAVWHGPLMALGFLGTLIGLERAVALGRRWAYAAPMLSGLGALVLLAGGPVELAAALVTAGGAVLVAIFAAIYDLQPALHSFVMGVGALAWVVAGVLWLLGWPVSRFVPWLAAFLVITIAAERLELSRMTMPSRRRRVAFLAAAGLLLAGAVVSIPSEQLGARVTGLGLVALAGWLMRYDVARRTVRQRGLTRFMALCLLAGYVWLGVAGLVWTWAGPTAVGFAYDARLHALFLGFVMSMVFGHEPVIVPAVLRLDVRFSGWFYAYLALLHASLLFRVAGGDLLSNPTMWRWGGLLNVVAVMWFLASTIWSTRSAGGSRSSHRMELWA